MSQQEFLEIVHIIKQAREKVARSVNAELINLYWNIGEYISKRVEAEKWGKSVVKKLAEFLEKTEPNAKGFSDKNLWRMKQFYETYRDFTKLSPVVRQIGWTSNLLILSKTQSSEEREFYLNLCKRERYSKRELERQINSCTFERVAIGNAKFAPTLKKSHPQFDLSFKDSYVLEFLNLPEIHNESDLQKGLIRQMKNFILELGKDFTFVGEEYKIEVGNSDFFIDLLFYHRALQCLVVFELKTSEFKPEYLGQLNFYLEALDRDLKKPNENPSIGVLLCKGNDVEVVEYALSRSLSPTMIAEYKTQLPDKKILRQKLHEIFESMI
jgi:predicted nuclease of restriction endonuclease-like (RecB) superfamily